MDMPFIIEVKGENGKLKSKVRFAQIYKYASQTPHFSVFTFQFSVP